MFKIMTENREMVIQGEMSDELFDSCVGFVLEEYKKLSGKVSTGGVQKQKTSPSEGEKPKRRGGRPKKAKPDEKQDAKPADTGESP